MCVQVNLTTVYTPHSNGTVEQQNCIIIQIIRTTLEGMGNTWNLILPFIQFHMNNSYISSIGMMSLQVFLGFNPITPVSMLQNRACQHPTAVEFVTLHNTYHQRARDALQTAQLKLVERMDQGRDTTKSFQVKDAAWLSSTHITGPEDSRPKRPWCGPFSVVAATQSMMTLDLPSHWSLTSNTFHVEKVKKHVDRPAHLGTHSQPPVLFRRQGQDY